MTRFMLRMHITLKTIKVIFRRPTYWVIAITSAVLMLGVVLWSLNIELLAYVLFEAPVSINQKLRFILYGYQSLIQSFSLQNIAMVLFSILFGINLALLVYVLKGRHLMRTYIPVASSGGAALFGILSGGCAACGTSLLTPIISAIGGAAVANATEQVGTGLSILGSLLIIYSLSKLSAIASQLLAIENQRRSIDNEL